MGNNKEIRVVLGTLRYKSAPETSFALQVPFVQNVKASCHLKNTNEKRAGHSNL